jgi:hypothetical protein
MALMARLRRIEAGIEWLETEGMFRVCKTQVKFLKMQEQIEARLARDPGDEHARWLAPYLGIKLPPLPKPVVYSPPPPAPAPPPSAPARAPPEEPRVARERSFADVVQVPPVSSPPPPPVAWETHDILEHMQIRPVRWRQRDASDVDDWEDGERDYSQCLTEYDPIEEDDDS